MISILLMLNWPDEREAARLSFTARIVSLMRDVRDMRDGPNGEGLMDSPCARQIEDKARFLISSHSRGEEHQPAGCGTTM